MKNIDDIDELADELNLEGHEKIEKLREFKEMIEEQNDGDEEVSISGEFQLRVLDEDGNEKSVESQKFKY